MHAQDKRLKKSKSLSVFTPSGAFTDFISKPSRICAGEKTIRESSNMKNTIRTIASLAGIAMMTTGAAKAADMASGDDIRAQVSGKTVQGSMLRDTFQKYSEFYMEDGTIKGDGYGGKWTIEGDTMCFAYGDTSSGCWAASIEGPAIIFFKDGKVDGVGVAKAGNGNNY
jgi:hypothetical protein